MLGLSAGPFCLQRDKRPDLKYEKVTPYEKQNGLTQMISYVPPTSNFLVKASLVEAFYKRINVVVVPGHLD